MDDFFSLLAQAALTVLIYMTVWFVISIIAKRTDVVDIAWGLGFPVVAFSALSGGEATAGAVTGCILALIWGLRLSLHIGKRNIKKAEDYRYQAKRDAWGDSFLVRAYFQIFLAQGIVMLLIATPLLVLAAYAPAGTYALLYAGVLVWLAGFFFEAVGDKQLADFLKNPANKGHVMQRGLWRYSRHPNYFGEVTQWWGIGLMALGVPYGFIGLIGPLAITFFILKVSGVPLLEQKKKDDPEFQNYKRRTSMFIPLPPRKA